MCMRMKWNVKINKIQQLMLAPGLRSGLFNMPLIYLASTSTIRLRTPMSHSFKAWNEQYRPYNSSLGCKKRDGSESRIVTFLGVVSVALTKMISNCDVGSIDG